MQSVSYALTFLKTTCIANSAKAVDKSHIQKLLQHLRSRLQSGIRDLTVQLQRPAALAVTDQKQRYRICHHLIYGLPVVLAIQRWAQCMHFRIRRCCWIGQVKRRFALIRNGLPCRFCNKSLVLGISPSTNFLQCNSWICPLGTQVSIRF